MLICLLSLAGATGAVEALEYRGMFSAGSDLAIADLDLEERRTAQGPALERVARAQL